MCSMDYTWDYQGGTPTNGTSAYCLLSSAPTLTVTTSINVKYALSIDPVTKQLGGTTPVGSTSNLGGLLL